VLVALVAALVTVFAEGWMFVRYADQPPLVPAGPPARSPHRLAPAAVPGVVSRTVSRSSSQSSLASSADSAIELMPLRSHAAAAPQ